MTKAFLSALMLSSVAFAEGGTRKLAQVSPCGELTLVELTVERLGPETNVQNGAWIGDQSVYIGWGADVTEAQASAREACTAGKVAAAACQNAKIATVSVKGKYLSALKKLTGCK